MKERIDTLAGAPPVGPYSPAVRANGLIFASGQIPLDPESGKVIKGPIATQVRQTLENLQMLLEAGGSSLSKTVKCTVYLSDLQDFQAMNEVYSSYFHDKAPPARTTIQAAQLPMGADVEIDAIALV